MSGIFVRHLLACQRIGKIAFVLVCASTAALAGGSASANEVETVEQAASTDASAQQLIKDMAHALTSLNYEGVFVHAQGTSLTSMRIVHSYKQGDILERLTALDGEAREVIRNNSLVTCIWPNSESVVVSQAKPRRMLPEVDKSLANSDRYTFSLGAPDRVANRATHVVNVVPRDQYRYGYRFWIDTQTSMLLRSALVDGQSNPVEQVIFTQIRFPDAIDVSLFDVLASQDGREVVSWLEPKQADAAAAAVNQAIENESVSRSSATVEFTNLPDGYAKVSEAYSTMPRFDGPVTHIMLSDGMASVSVYVEFLSDGQRSNGMLGLSNMGAMNAFGLSTNQAHITAVGEVPEATVRAIAAAVVLSE